MKLKKMLFLSFSGLFLLSGCASTTANQISPNISKTPVTESNIKIKVNLTPGISPFEKNLIQIAKQAEIEYNEYVEILKDVKKKKILPATRIPKNMGKRLTFCFDGYALLLIKNVVQDAGYTFELGNLRIQDSPIIHRCYRNTTIADILEDVSSDVGYDVIINEKTMTVKVKYNNE